MAKHTNDGNCLKCLEIIQRYPNPNTTLLNWFKAFQKNNPEAHCSCFGRGKIDQETQFVKGASRAHYGKSAHNYNCALDVFVMKKGLDLYDENWFNTVLSKALITDLSWYGKKGSEFFELPHIQVSNWKDLVKQNLVKLVEPTN